MRVAIIGAGGCAREIAWTVAETPGFEVVAFAITDPAHPGVSDHLSTPRFPLNEMIGLVDGFVLGIGSPEIRRRVIEQVRTQYPDQTWPTVIHPSATIGPGCSFGAGVVICARTTVTVNVRLEDHVLVHYNCTISHETIIGTNTVLNPLACVSGAARVGRDVLIGAGAHVLQCRTIADGATIGAGAVVTRDVPAATTVVGVPARPVAAKR